MMLSSVRNRVIKFIESSKEFPVIAGVASGLYPLIYNYERNFTLINSWRQFAFYFITYLLIPVLLILTASLFIRKARQLKRYSHCLIPVFNCCFFAFFIVLSSYGLRWKILALALGLAFLIAILFAKHIKKIIVFQFILAALVSIKLAPDLYKYITYSSTWMQQPDDIEFVEFEKRPNVYVIQPDGYANFSELNSAIYKYDASVIESFLVQNNFKLYPNFRSNYFSTLSSNSSMFSMKHHYYNNPNEEMNELYNSRDIIVGKNPVLSIFKKNNYKTFLILEKSYLLLNRPEIDYDYCNFDFSEVSYLARGFEMNKDLIKSVEETINRNQNTSNFYFIEKFSPWHISNNYSSNPNAVEIQRQKYIERIEITNTWLQEIITKIRKIDRNSLIIIAADHGGYVGMNNAGDKMTKLDDERLTRSIFTSALAIHWPDQAPDFDIHLKSNVNLFRVLFSYLSNDENYLNNLQEDKSYSVIENGAPYGVYELINEKGEVVFNKFSK